MKMKVSVALITYNRPQFLHQAIQAILNQEFTDFEFLILDNGSSEETKEVILQFNDKRIKYIRNDYNQREFYNIGFKIALGEYLLITHDDDLLLPNFLVKTVELMDKYPESVVVSTNACSIDGNNKIITPNLMRLNNIRIFKKFQYISHFIRAKYGIICPSALMRKDFFLSNGLDFDFSVGPAADNYLWIKCNLSDKTLIINNEILYKYRIHENQDSYINKISMNTQLYHALVILFKKEKLYRLLPIFSLRLLINFTKSFQKGLVSKLVFLEQSNQLKLSENGLLERLILIINKFIISKMPYSLIAILKFQNRIRILFFNKNYFKIY